MPVYRYRCATCGDYEEWWSITATPLLVCPTCQSSVVQVFTPPHLYGVGEKGTRTREVDTKEKEWATDMPAYRRLRKEGHQPRSIDGSAKMEATAQSGMEIDSGGIITGPERQIQQAMADVSGL